MAFPDRHWNAQFMVVFLPSCLEGGANYTMSLQHVVSTVSIEKNTTLVGVLEGSCPWDSAYIDQQEFTLLLLMALSDLVCSGVVSSLTP